MLTFALRVCACCASGACAFETCRIVVPRLQRMRGGKTARAPNLDDVLADGTLTFIMLAGMACAVSASLSLWVLPVLLVLAYAASRYAPAYMEKRRCRTLRSACDGELDVLADIVAMGTRAGLSFDAALVLYCERFDTELSRQMQASYTAWSSGLTTRERALADMASRLDSAALRRFGDTVVQALHYGAPLAESLVRFAWDLRQSRMVSIERQVEKAPVKMLVPMGIFILPAMLVLVMGPVVLQFLGSDFV